MAKNIEKIDPEKGFTSDVITDPHRFVGRKDVIRDCISALNSPLSLIAIYGKRGVGKSSLLRQVQQMALGDYTIAKLAGLDDEIPTHPRKYLTVFYTCDSIIESGADLINRLCNDQDVEDGFLRLVPNNGKEVVEFQRTVEASGACDLKVVKWGGKGIESKTYSKTNDGDLIQTFRNNISAVIQEQVKKRMHRDGLLILLDEFDVIKNKDGIGSLIKSLSSKEVKFGICGIGQDLQDLVDDHNSVERLLEQGAIHVKPMGDTESRQILEKAEVLFENKITFDKDVKTELVRICQGYPYFMQMLGKSCVTKTIQNGKCAVDNETFRLVLNDIKTGAAFPTLESNYRKAIGDSPNRRALLHLMANIPESKGIFQEDVDRILLKNVRREVEANNVEYLDQNLPRLLDKNFGPVLRRIPSGNGIYEFINPVFRLYVSIREQSDILS